MLPAGSCYYCNECNKQNNREHYARKKGLKTSRVGHVKSGSWNTSKTKEWNLKHPFRFDVCEAVANYQIYTGKILI